MVIPASPDEYVTRYRHRFDSHRFAAIPEDRSNEPGNHEDRATAWLSRWRHVPYHERVPRDMVSDLEWVRCDGEVPFVDNLRRIWQDLSDTDRSEEQTVFRQHLYPCTKPYGRMYWLDRYRWGEDAQRDARLRIHRGASGDRALLMSGWHNREMHQMPIRTRGEFYAEQPQWWHHFEPHPALCIPTPSTLAYLGSETITNAHGLMRVVWSIALSEHIPNCFWGWLEAARWGLHNFAHRSTDEGFFAADAERRFRGRMFYISDRLLSYFENAGIPWMVEGSDISAGVAERALHQMRWYFQHHTTEYWAAYEWEDDLFYSERLPRQVSAPGLPVRIVPSGSDQPSESHQVGQKRRRAESGRGSVVEDAGILLLEPPAAPIHRVYPRSGPKTPCLVPSTAGPSQPSPAIPLSGPSATLLLRSKPVEPTKAVRTENLSTGWVSIPQKEFAAFQDDYRQWGDSVPNTLTEALETARVAMRKASLYDWLTKSVGAFRESLETQMGMVCVQASSLLGRQLEAVRRAEDSHPTFPPDLPEVMSTEQLNTAAGIVRDRWKRHLAPAISYPTQDPVQEAIASQRNRAGPSTARANLRLDEEVIDLTSS